MVVGCFGCGGPLDGLLCRWCTCEWCINNLRNGFCSFCASRAGNSFVYDPNPNSFNDPPNFFNHPPQPQYQTYSCELCGNDSHYGYDCPPRVPLVYEQEPSYNQNFGDNPQNSPSFSQQYICCVHCGGPHENFQCQPWHQNYVEPNPSNSYGFDQTPQNSIDHQPQSIQEDLNQQRMNDVLKAMQSLVEKLRQQEQAANLSTHTPEPSRRFNFIYDDDDDDDDDEESTIPLNEIISQIPPSIAITPVLPTMEPEDSLNMKDEHLSTITKKESDKVIKSSVEDLVPIPSESEETFDNDSECDLPFCDDSFPLDVLRGGKFKTYSNPLFEFDDKYISSDVNPLFNEVLEDIESKDSYVSNLDEPALLVTHLSELNEDECFDPGGDEIEACLASDSIPPGIDGADFDPEGDILLLGKLLNDDISFSLPSKELHFEGLKVIKSYIPSNFKDDYYDSEGDTIYLKSLLINDIIPNLRPEVFFDHDPKGLNDEPDNDDLKSMIKVFDPGIHEKIISPTHVRLPFEDGHYFSLTFVIKIFLPFLIYLVNSLPLFSSESEDLIFDPGISTFSFYSLEPVAYESPMTIFPFFYFCPKDKGIQGESS
ncbi:hypothetical protein Tco_1308529 [Tanacetum coccineum]